MFTPGATAGLNAVALSWGLANLADGDEILYSPNDHSSNVYPWWHLRQVLARFRPEHHAGPVRGEPRSARRIRPTSRPKVSPRTRLITVTHVHNVFGVV